MNATTKTFAVFSLSAAVGKMIIDSGESDQEKWRGQKLYEAGIHAAAVYPSHHLTENALVRIGNAVENLCNQTTPIERVLSMVLAALVDIRAFVQSDRHGYIDPLIKRVKCAMDYYSAQDDVHIAAYDQYIKWAES